LHTIFQQRKGENFNALPKPIFQKLDEGSKKMEGLTIILMFIPFAHCMSATKSRSVRELQTSVGDPDPGSGALLTTGAGIRNRVFPDPGSLETKF
jgi:hypothetical protein